MHVNDMCHRNTQSLWQLSLWSTLHLVATVNCSYQRLWDVNNFRDDAIWAQRPFCSFIVGQPFSKIQRLVDKIRRICRQSVANDSKHTYMISKQTVKYSKCILKINKTCLITIIYMYRCYWITLYVELLILVHRFNTILNKMTLTINCSNELSVMIRPRTFYSWKWNVIKSRC